MEEKNNEDFEVLKQNMESEEKVAKLESLPKSNSNQKIKNILFYSFFFLSIILINIFMSFAIFDYMQNNKNISYDTQDQNSYIIEDDNQNQVVINPTEVVEEESQTIKVAKSASPAVVSIIATTEVPTYETLYGNFFNFNIPSQVQNGTEKVQSSAGTGFLVSTDGYIVTNKHVVDDEEAEYTVILNNEENFDEKIEAEVLARDPDNDIAILKIEKDNLPFLQLGDSDSLQIGQTAIAIGYALGEFDNTVSKGVVSGLYRSIVASAGDDVEYLQDLIQTDAAVNPGNSGGPLLNIEGKVIGVNVAMADAQSIGFAIPINEVKEAYEDVKISGTISEDVKAFLGVRYSDIDENVQNNNNLPYNYGAFIAIDDTGENPGVLPDSPADKAGLEDGDIILEVDGKKITARNPLVKLIRDYKPGDKVKLKIYKNGEEKEIEVELGEKS